MTIKIKEGNWYVLKDGKVIGPAELNPNFPSKEAYPFILVEQEINGYTERGTYYHSGRPSKLDVVREATDAEVVEQLKPGQSTPHNGRVLFRSPTRGSITFAGARQQGKLQKMLDILINPPVTTTQLEEYVRLSRSMTALYSGCAQVYAKADSRTPIEKAADEVTGIAETMAEQAKKDKATIDALNKQADIGNKTIRELEAEVRRLKASEQGLYRALNATTQERDRYFNAGQGQQGVIAGKDRVIADLQTAARNANKRADDLLAENNKLRTSQWTGAVYRYDVGGGEYRGVPHSSVEHELTLLYQQVNVARNDARNAHKLADEANARAAKIAKERDALLTK